jgi:uncharacterized low-complexity protein
MATLLAVSVLLSTVLSTAGVRDSFEDALVLEDDASSSHEAKIHRHAAASNKSFKGECKEAKCGSKGQWVSYIKKYGATSDTIKQMFAIFKNCKLAQTYDSHAEAWVDDTDAKPKPPSIMLAGPEGSFCREQCDLEVAVEGEGSKTETYANEYVWRNLYLSSTELSAEFACEPQSFVTWQSTEQEPLP